MTRTARSQITSRAARISGSNIQSVAPADTGAATFTKGPRFAGACRLFRLGQRYAPHHMSLKRGKHLAGETANLFEEHLMWHSAAIEADLYSAGAGLLGRSYDALGDFLGRAPGHGLGLAGDVIHGHIAKILAWAFRSAQVLMPHITRRCGRGVAGCTC